MKFHIQNNIVVWYSLFTQFTQLLINFMCIPCVWYSVTYEEPHCYLHFDVYCTIKYSSFFHFYPLPKHFHQKFIAVNQSPCCVQLYPKYR